MKILSMSLFFTLISNLHPSFSQFDERKGLFDRVDLIQTNWYAFNYAQYNPNTKLMKKLIELYDENITVEIVFGFWCSDTQTQLPAFLRVADSLHVTGRPIAQILIGTDKSKTYNGNLSVDFVPTFIFKKFGIEIGRIVETPHKSFEKDMIDIFKKAAKIKSPKTITNSTF